MDGAIVRLFQRTALIWARRVLPWLLRHPFVFRPSTWGIGLIFGLALGWLSLKASFLPGFLGAVLVLAAIGVALVGWQRLAKASLRPVLFVAQFLPATPGAEEVSLNHQIAMHQRLSQNTMVRDHFALRELPAPIGTAEAERLLQVLGSAQAVVRGKVQAVADVGSFEAILTFEPQLPEDPDRVRERQRTRWKAAEHHRVAPDHRLKLEELIGPEFHAAHADGIEGMLLVLLAEEHIARAQVRKADDCLKAAAPLKDHLPEAGKAHLVVGRIFLDNSSNLAKAVTEMRRAGEDQIDHPALWNAAAWLAMTALSRNEIGPATAVQATRRAVQASPKSRAARLMLVDALSAYGHSQEAKDELRALSSEPTQSADPEILLRYGALSYNSNDIGEAQKAYKGLIRVESSARAHLYLADTYIRENNIREARHHYREALLRQPDLVDAHRGYWWKTPEGEEKGSFFFDRMYMLIANRRFLPRQLKFTLLYRLLLWHYKKHPEDSRVHYMLGAHALLRKDLETAEERLTFAKELVGGVDTQATARLAVVRILQGRYPEAKDELLRLRSIQLGHHPTQDDHFARIYDLLSPLRDEPDLLPPDRQRRLEMMTTEVFPEINKPGAFDKWHQSLRAAS